MADTYTTNLNLIKQDPASKPDIDKEHTNLDIIDTLAEEATTSAAGLMSAADKTKLDGVATGATANIGTITGITMNGASKGTSGVVDLGTVITAHQDISGKVSKSGDTMTGNLTMGSGTNISYAGTGATYALIKFVDGDAYGQGIVIGGGGLTIIGGGESADAIASGKSGNTEAMYIGNDGAVYVMTNCQSGVASAKTFTFDTSGNLTVPGTIYRGTQDMGKAVKSITRSGTTFTATCCDGTTFTFTQQDSNTWRGYQTKEYSYRYTASANSAVKITGTNFGVSTPSGYTPVAVASFDSGAGSGVVIPTIVNPTTTGGGTVMMLRNTSSSSQTFTASIKILYLQT